MSSTSSIKVRKRLLARHGSAQFTVELRAVKPGAGLIQTDRTLNDGDKLILHVPGSENGGVVQLFATVARHYPQQGAFALRWLKLVSPTGTTALVKFLRDTLGVGIAPGTAMADEVVDGEMAYYEFQAQEFHLPNRGVVVGRKAPSTHTALTEPTTDFSNVALTDTIRNQVTRPMPKDSAGRELTGRQLEAEALKAATEAEASGTAFFKEDEEVVELFGMKVSKDNWERLENLQYSGSHPKVQAPTPAKQRPKASPPPRAQRTEHSQDDEKAQDDAKDNAVSSFFRKIANRLADKD